MEFFTFFEEFSYQAYKLNKAKFGEMYAPEPFMAAISFSPIAAHLATGVSLKSRRPY